MIKAIIFDIGGVYIQDNFNDFFRYFNETDLSLVHKVYLGLRKVNPDVSSLVKKLKKKYRVAALSNTLSYFAELNKKRNLYKEFDNYILSSDVGCLKPQKKIYELMLNKLKLKPEECVFIDNIYIFLPSAKKLGMKTIYFRNARQVEKELKSIGVKF